MLPSSPRDNFSLRAIIKKALTFVGAFLVFSDFCGRILDVNIWCVLVGIPNDNLRTQAFPGGKVAAKQTDEASGLRCTMVRICRAGACLPPLVTQSYVINGRTQFAPTDKCAIPLFRRGVTLCAR